MEDPSRLTFPLLACEIAPKRLTVLDQLLTALDVRVNAFATCEIYAGWRLKFAAAKEPSIHYVLSGSGAIRVPDCGPIALLQDTLVVIPRGVTHAFEGTGEGRLIDHEHLGGAQPDGTTVAKIRAGEGERCLVVACGTIRAAFAGSLGLFDHLTHPIVERFAAEPLGSRFQILLDELAQPSLGTRALTEAFLKQAVVLVLRRQTQQAQGRLPWLQAFQDSRLARAVAAIFERPEHPFTLDELVAVVGMSRSAFAEHFTAAFGQSPMEFAKQVRLHRAAHLLEVTDLPIKAVAKRIGYESRGHFSRAFRGVYGLDPTKYRTSHALRASSSAGSPSQ